LKSSYKINRLHKINKRRNTPFTTITIVIFILGYVVLWFISKPQGLWGWAYLINTVLVLICIYAALIAKGFKKIILYTLVIIFILGSVIIASLGPIEQLGEANVSYRPKAGIDMLQEMQDYLDADKEALWIKDCEPYVQNIIEQADIQKMFTIDLIS